MSGMMSPARFSSSARNGSSPAISNAGAMYSLVDAIEVDRLERSDPAWLPSAPRGPGFTPNGMATNACGLAAMRVSYCPRVVPADRSHSRRRRSPRARGDEERTQRTRRLGEMCIESRILHGERR